jgi:glycosyltransferase involved in cell wall biosynthesis
MISIIITVKNSREIEETLNSLSNVKRPERTEIVVIDVSKRKTLLDIKRKFPAVKWSYYINQTNKKITTPEQRNEGIKKSLGDILILLDAGCIVDKNWLIELTKPIREGKEFFVSGKVESLEKGAHKNWNPKEEGYINQSGGANIAFSKEIVSIVGYFDETFNYGSDIDFSWRTINRGYKIKYNPNAIVYHNWGNWRADIKRGIMYGEARVNLYKKHLSRIKNLFNPRLDMFILYYPLFFIYVLSLIPITFLWGYYPLFLLIPVVRSINSNPLRKMVFDFFFGLGIIMQLVKVSLRNYHEKI